LDALQLTLAEHPRNFGNPLLISATIEASNFKFGTHTHYTTWVRVRVNYSIQLTLTLTLAHYTTWVRVRVNYSIQLTLKPQRGCGLRYSKSFNTKLRRGWLVYTSTSKIVWTM